MPHPAAGVFRCSSFQPLCFVLPSSTSQPEGFLSFALLDYQGQQREEKGSQAFSVVVLNANFISVPICLIDHFVKPPEFGCLGLCKHIQVQTTSQ